MASYRAPEEKSRPEPNKRADLWSLGALLHELVFLQGCQEPKSEALLHESTLPASGERAHLNYSKDLTDLIAELLREDPYKRPKMATLAERKIFKDHQTEPSVGNSTGEVQREGREPQDAQPLDWDSYTDMEFKVHTRNEDCDETDLDPLMTTETTDTQDESEMLPDAQAVDHLHPAGLDAGRLGDREERAGVDRQCQ